MHISVLKKETIEFLGVKANRNFVDATFGEGGHSLEIVKRNGPRGKILAFEIDPELYQLGKRKIKRFAHRIILVNENFARLKDVVKEKGFGPVSGILFDLGISSWHIECSKRGFSFQREEPLLMKYDLTAPGPSAKDILNSWPPHKIERILREYGNESFSLTIAQAIVREREKRKIETTIQLVDILKKVLPTWYQRKKIHFATKTFLALRIATNNELENLKCALPESYEVLDKKGRLVVVSFHSMEDKIVKNFFRKLAKEKMAILLTKKPISPTEEEIKYNPRSRSARLRAIEKI